MSNNKKTKKTKNDLQNNSQSEREDKLSLKGIVEDALPGTWFKVKLIEGGAMVLATLSGKLRQNHIHILPGDQVIVEVSPYDTSRGRIAWRS